MTDDIDKFVVEQLYEVVSSPEQYDEFMRSLETKMTSLREMNAREPSKQLQSHLDRASNLVDFVTPWRGDSESALRNFPSISVQPMMAVNRGGQVVDANRAARVLYDLTPDATLANLPLDVEELAKLRKMLVGAIDGHGKRNNPNDVVPLQNHTTQRPILITMHPFEDTDNAETLAIIKTSDVNWPSHLGSILNDLFDLTPAETEVLRLLVNGERVDDIAKIRNNSVATIRTQLRAIYSKTNTTSQMDCIRLIMGLALMHSSKEGRAIAQNIEASRGSQAYPRPEDRLLFKLNNGRQIEYATFGAPNGRPILFCHDQVLGDTWFCEAVEDAIRSGLKIISPLRPGFGRTTMYEKKSSDPHIFARDVRELLDGLGVGRLPIIAMRSGLVHGLALAAIIPKRICSITVGNPILPVLNDADLDGTNGYNRLIPHTRIHFPQALKFLVKTGFAFVSTKGPEAFVTALLRASPKDIEWATRPDIMPNLVHGLVVHRQNGYKGSYGDIAYKKDWSDLLAHSPVPVRLVIGENDRNVQWAASKRWAVDHDHITLTILPNSGYLVLYQETHQFLAWAKEDMTVSALSE